SVPTTPIQAGDIIPVSWTVTNQGTRDTRTNSWADGVYLSRTAALTADGKQLATLPHGGYEPPLAKGQSYTRTLNVQVPYGIAGDFHLLVFTDMTVIEIGGAPQPNLAGEQRFLRGGGMGYVLEFQDEANNLAAVPLHMMASP